MRKTAGLLAIALLIGSAPVLAEEDEDWDERGWDELDEPRPEAQVAGRPMALGAQSLPAGGLALKGSLGYPFLGAGVHYGLTDSLDLTAEFMMPFTMFAQAFWMGAGGKWKFLQLGSFGYALSLRVFGVLYDDPADDMYSMAPGLFIWPSFVIDFQVPFARIYGEIGAIFYPFVAEGSPRDYVFFGVPMRFGGEIPISENMHAFVNLDLGISVFMFFVSGFEGGILFLF